MDSGGKQPFELHQLPRVQRQIRELAKKAMRAGIKDIYLDALKTLIVNLQTDPLQWGDPEYHLRKEGSSMFHGICVPLFVSYVVFEDERKVIVLNIKPLPMSLLA